MRKIVLGAGISLDGYISTSDGQVDWMWMDPDYSMAGFFQSIDAAIMGRKTYEDALKMGGGGGSFGGMATYVVSSTLPAGRRDGVEFCSGPVEALAKDLKTREGKDIWLMGGGELARSFLQADQVDEIHLGVLPILLGEGRPLFPAGFPRRRFLLDRCQNYPTGMLALYYRRGEPPAKATPTKRKPARRSQAR